MARGARGRASDRQHLVKVLKPMTHICYAPYPGKTRNGEPASYNLRSIDILPNSQHSHAQTKVAFFHASPCLIFYVTTG